MCGAFSFHPTTLTNPRISWKAHYYGLLFFSRLYNIYIYIGFKDDFNFDLKNEVKSS